MTKLTIILGIVLLIANYVDFIWAKPASDSYSTKYDNFDVQSVLVSKRLVMKYGDCLLDRGACTPEGRFLKEIIPDAIASKCSKCNEKQKKQAGLMLQHLLLHYRPLFDELTAKYDPSGEVKKMYGIDKEPESVDYENYDDA